MEKNTISVERTPIPRIEESDQIKWVHIIKIGSWVKSSSSSGKPYTTNNKLKKDSGNLFWYVLDHFSIIIIKNNNLIIF